MMDSTFLMGTAAGRNFLMGIDTQPSVDDGSLTCYSCSILGF